MTNSRTATALATAAILLAAVTGCAEDGTDPPDVESSSTVSPTTSTGTPSTPTLESDSDAAAREASTLVRSYYAVRDELRTEPTAKLGKLRDVAISGELAAQLILFKRGRTQGQHQTGDTQIAALTVQAVNLDNSDPAAGRIPTVQVDVCYDVTRVDILDMNGDSIVPNDRPDTGWIRYLVSNYNFEADPSGSWRVASSQNLERTPCNPS